jgi:hypothetical protein
VQTGFLQGPAMHSNMASDYLGAGPFSRLVSPTGAAK